MSVLIRGMEMPHGCDDCRLKKSYVYAVRSDECAYYCRNVDPYVGMGKRTDWCPLLYVPPHGRLIDADALINALQELFDRRNIDAEYTGFRGASVSWNDAICYIKDAPTIIEAEE